MTSLIRLTLAKTQLIRQKSINHNAEYLRTLEAHIRACRQPMILLINEHQKDKELTVYVVARQQMYWLAYVSKELTTELQKE
jgi:hypothetical protein